MLPLQLLQVHDMDSVQLSDACIVYVQGPILAFIYAVKEMLEEGQGADGSLPVNVAFVFEGEEENGTLSLCLHCRHLLHPCMAWSLQHGELPMWAELQVSC